MPKNRSRTFLFVIVAALLLLFQLGGLPVEAQELQSQPAPFTAWLDFKSLSNPLARRPALPIWVESVEIVTPETDASALNAPNALDAKKNVVRIRLRNFAGLNDEIMLRVYFFDSPQSHPVVSSWTELGSQVGDSKALGNGLGFSTHETLILPTQGIAYIEIQADENLLRGALLASLKNTVSKQALDFEPSALLNDPFLATPASVPAKNDTLLFGRVKATLDDSVVKLSGTDSDMCLYEFEIDRQPLVAVLSFELLNADPANPPQLSVNNIPLGAVSLHLPDLADPAYRGSVLPLRADMQFHYNGWIKCQKIIPASSLTGGLNKAVIQTGSDPAGFAIRTVELQLKYGAQTLDYDLKP